MPWLERVLPNIVAITSAHAERTVFTRFIPARKPGHGVGMWRHYYERWAKPGVASRAFSRSAVGSAFVVSNFKD
jgi:hypothetical protein